MVSSEQPPPASACDLAPLEDDLNNLRKELITAQKAQQTAEIDIQQGNARITAVESLIGDFDAIIMRYRDRYQQLKDRQDNFKEHCEKETQCFVANLTESLAKRIIDTSNQVLQNISKRREELAAHETECATKRSDLVKLRQERDDALAKLSQLRQLDTAIGARHSLLDAQRQAVQTERDAHQYNVAYYLLKGKYKFCTTVDAEPKVLTVDELCLALKSAWHVYKEKDESYNKKNAEAQACERALATLRTQLEQDEGAVETVIRRKVSQLSAPAPSSSY